MDRRDLAIGVLSTTAVILLVGLVVVHSQPQPAYASGMGDRGGDYIALTGAMWAQEEMLYIFDTSQSKMMVYRYDQNTKQILANGPANLDHFLAGNAPAPPNRRGRGRP